MQPCMSPVWDTAQAVSRWARPAFREERSAHGEGCGLDAVQGSSPQGRLGGEGPKNAEPGGWYFEFNNEFYPDTMIRRRFCWR
jgi:squalene-hopene/tetraprenyl-beta-curcumene cyclase